MSNEVAPQNQELQIPDWLSDMIEAGNAKSNASTLVSTISSVPRISLRGQKFRFIENGEEVRREADKVHLVILGVQPENGMAKTYYEGDYSGENEPPTCSSWDGIKPDDWVATKQSDLCATCQWNKWGSAKSRSGGKAKKCRDSKRLMVVDPRDVSNGTVYILNVTVASLKNLSTFGKALASKNIPMEAVITTVIMEEGADIPILHFNPAGIMKKDSALAAIARGQKREWNSGLLEDRREASAALEDRTGDQQAAKAQTATAPATVATPKAIQEPAKPVETAAPKQTSATGDEDLDALLSKW